MEIKRKWLLWAGGVLGLFIFASYFIKFEVEGGGNYVVQDRLLGILIFHNWIVLAVYILIVTFLLIIGGRSSNSVNIKFK
jgi:hypothetical protein